MIMETQMMILETLKVSKNVITVDRATEEEKEIAQHMAKNVINVVGKTTSGLCVSPKNLESKCDSRRPNGARKNSNKYSHKCNVHDIEECQDDMEDLTEQVQSLFYH